jgi:hypothetical protein
VVGVLGFGVVSLLDVPSLVDNTSMGGTIATLRPDFVGCRVDQKSTSGTN